MPAAPRYLTKSRFKQAVECATKLFYTGKPAYLDNSLEDSFLATLAEGGYQVGALACLMYPDGVEVKESGHVAQLQRTRELLAHDEVTIYEAALQAQDLFIRVDILRKRGDQIELIEVKAKSYHPDEHGDLRGARGNLRADFLPYLQDIAFQRHVAGLAFPGFEYHCCLLLVDKSATATVDGLNQRFRVRRSGRQVVVDVAPGTDASSIGAPILTAVPVDDQVAEIIAGSVRVAGMDRPFAEAVRELRKPTGTTGDWAPFPPLPAPVANSRRRRRPPTPSPVVDFMNAGPRPMAGRPRTLPRARCSISGTSRARPNCLSTVCSSPHP